MNNKRIAHELLQYVATARWNIRCMLQAFVAILLIAVSLADVSMFWHAVDVVASQRRVAPVVIAHRGDAGSAENSLQAVFQAAKNGADYAEIDVRLTKDGWPVAFHDRRTGRLSLEGRDVTVSHVSLRTLQGMRMYSKGMQYRVPTLRQMFAAAHSSGIGLLLDLKAGNDDAIRIARAISRETYLAGYKGPVMAMSANPMVMHEMRRFRPEWTVGYCASGKPESVDWRDDFDFVVLRGREMTMSFADDARRWGVPVFAGSVGDSRTASYCLFEGVEGMLGDDMTMLHHSVENSETKPARILSSVLEILDVHVGLI